jgi:hypothetical protein
MTDGQIGLLIIGAVALVWLFWRKKAPGVVFVELVEWIEVRPAKRPRRLVNVAVVAAVVLAIWAAAHR